MIPSISSNFVRLLCLCVFLALFASCENDDIVEEYKMPVESGLPTYVRKKLTRSSILKNKELSHTLDHLNNKVISSPEDFSKSNQNTYTGETTFTINRDVANYMEYGAYHSYTFPVSRSVDNGLLENLLLSLQNDGTYKSILIAYDVTEIEKKMMLNDELVDLDGKTSFTILHNQDWANNMNKSIGEPDNMCMSYTMTVPRCSFGGLHSATDIENNVNNGANCKSKPLGGVAEPYMTFYFTECEGRQAGSPGDAYTPPPYDDFGNYTGLGSPRDREPSGPSTGNDGQQPPDDEDNTNDPDPLEGNDNCVQQDHNGNCVKEMTAPIDNQTRKDCDELKKLADPLSLNIKAYVDTLKTKTGLSKEYAVSFQKIQGIGPMRNGPQPGGIAEGISKTESTAYTGTLWYGSVHTHPVGSDPMFSWTDVSLLRDTYRDITSAFQSEVFIMIVNNDGSVYALKISSYAALDRMVESVLNSTDGSTEKNKLENLNLELGDLNAKDGDLERVFLNEFKDFGISMYRATDDTMTNWNKLSLNNNSVQEEDACN